MNTWDINEKKKDVLIWIYEYWIWFHRYSPPSLFSPSFSHIWWDTLSRRDHFRKQFVATLDSDGWACPIDLPVTRSTACLLGCLKPEGEGLEGIERVVWVEGDWMQRRNSFFFALWDVRESCWKEELVG